MPNCRENGKYWSKFDQPQGYEGTKGKGKGQDFHTLAKTLTKGKGKGFWRVRVRVGLKTPRGYPCPSLPSKKKRVGNRETTRVKEYPGGNTATSSSRIAFLKTLCKVPSFLSLADLVPALVSCFYI